MKKVVIALLSLAVVGGLSAGCSDSDGCEEAEAQIAKLTLELEALQSDCDALSQQIAYDSICSCPPTKSVFEMTVSGNGVTLAVVGDEEVNCQQRR